MIVVFSYVLLTEGTGADSYDISSPMYFGFCEDNRQCQFIDERTGELDQWYFTFKREQRRVESKSNFIKYDLVGTEPGNPIHLDDQSFYIPKQVLRNPNQPVQ